MNRRSFVNIAALGAVAMAMRIDQGEAATLIGDHQNENFRNKNLKVRWQKLDEVIRGWWDADQHRATEKEICSAPEKTMLFLPFPYTTAGGSQAAFPEQYGWDTQFINLGLLAHDRPDIVRHNILDQLFMIERFGMVLNGNRTFYTTRGQPPLLAWSVENYLAAKNEDGELAMLAYPNLERAYTSYWNGPSHITPIGLSTCHDAGDKALTPEMAAECEAGLDFTPIFDGDVRHCVPIHINCALVRHAQVLASLAERFGWREKADQWRKEADRRSHLINQYCWDESKGCYFEYNYARKSRLPYYSLNAYWPLWAGIATRNQAKRVIDQLVRFDFRYGLAFTDKVYPNPYPQFKALEWAYPECWPPEQIIVAKGLERYGYNDELRGICRRYLLNVVDTWEKTGLTWERYNAVDGGHVCPVERTEVAPMHGWSSSSAVVIGRMVFGQELVKGESPVMNG